MDVNAIYNSSLLLQSLILLDLTADTYLALVIMHNIIYCFLIREEKNVFSSPIRLAAKIQHCLACNAHLNDSYISLLCWEPHSASPPSSYPRGSEVNTTKRPCRTASQSAQNKRSYFIKYQLMTTSPVLSNHQCTGFFKQEHTRCVSVTEAQSGGFTKERLQTLVRTQPH